MAILNKILNFLILVFAGVSLWFGWNLYERRTELRQHSQVLAATVTAMVAELDVNSQTDIASKVGDLGWKAFAATKDSDFDSFKTTKLLKAEDQAKGIMQQRNDLARVLEEIAEIFEVDGLGLANFQNASKDDEGNPVYSGYTKVLTTELMALHQRDEAIFARVEDIAFNLSIGIEKGALKDVTSYEGALDALADNLNQLNKRTGEYLEGLTGIVETVDNHEWQVDMDRLKDPDEYNAEIAAIHNDCATINDNLEQFGRIGVELDETRQNLEETHQALDDCSANGAQLDVKLENCETALVRCQDEGHTLAGVTIGPDGEPIATVVGGGPLKDIEGKIIDVNYDWNYVIIDLGQKDQIPRNMEMTVGRQGVYICKVIVTRVLANHCVADILPELNEGVVMEGDRVIQ